MTATEYIFAAAMTVLIVWLVAEVSIAGALEGPRSVQREASKNSVLCAENRRPG